MIVMDIFIYGVVVMIKMPDTLTGPPHQDSKLKCPLDSLLAVSLVSIVFKMLHVVTGTLSSAYRRSHSYKHSDQMRRKPQ